MKTGCKGVIGSELTFTLTEENTIHTAFMDDISTTPELRFSVSVYKDPDGVNSPYWFGVLYPEQVTRPFDYYPIQNTLTAADDLGNLQYVKHDSTGLLECLNRTICGVRKIFFTMTFAQDYTGSNQLMRNNRALNAMVRLSSISKVE